jgi:hypothetical protein
MLVFSTTLYTFTSRNTVILLFQEIKRWTGYNFIQSVHQSINLNAHSSKQDDYPCSYFMISYQFNFFSEGHLAQVLSNQTVRSFLSVLQILAQQSFLLVLNCFFIYLFMIYHQHLSSFFVTYTKSIQQLEVVIETVCYLNSESSIKQICDAYRNSFQRANKVGCKSSLVLKHLKNTDRLPESQLRIYSQKRSTVTER